MIEPPAQGAPAKTALAGGTEPANGLYLVQFESAPGPEVREMLASHGVHLLQFVPEDAYVARLRSVLPAQVRALPGVLWVGKYLPRHKLHESLTQPAKRAANTKLGVALLLARDSSAPELASLKLMLSDARQESSFAAGTVLRADVNGPDLDALAVSEAVLWVEPDAKMKLFDEVSSKLVAGDGGPGKLFTASLGYDGSGVTVAVADSGLNNGDAATMHPDLLGRTPAFFHYGGLLDAADEHSHGTHVAGIIAGNGAVGEVDENGALYGLGVAPGASIIGQRIFDGAGNYYPPPSFERMTRDAVRAGAHIGSNSWGDDTQGRYDLSAMEFDALVRDADGLQSGDQPYILEFSAGNAGPGVRTIGSPAVAKNVIATGASQNDRVDFIIYGDGIDAMADFSSRGPCEDGRIKPDVVAPGTWIASLQSGSATDIYAWSPISPNYMYQGGTSQAGPHASGAAAIFVQYYRETHGGATPSPALVKAALVNSAFDLDNSFGTTFTPNMDEGWGCIDLTYLLEPEIKFLFTDQTEPLAAQQTFERTVLVAGNGYPLKVTLAYTDVPGFPGTLPALVNDLDLQVIAPDGTLYVGNQFLDGESIPGATLPDTINNVEGVHVPNPIPGEYRVRVVARRIAQDARIDTAALDQDFALVISAVQPVPGVATVSFDRPAYTVPANVRLVVIDPDVAAQSVSATVRSTSEPNGEVVLLQRASASGSFTGSVATALAPAAADGRLQVANNDTLEVLYFDASAGVNRFATAVADLVGPAIAAVTATTDFGRVVVKWTTDEPARSIVRFGTNNLLASLSSAVTNTPFLTQHAVVLEGLSPATTYYYYVTAQDAAGNSSTNLNNGALYTFVVPATPPLLLVDAYIDDLFGAPDLSGYTEPLNRVGVPYDTWDVETKGSPTASVLSRYRAVIWRVPEFTEVWSAAEQGVISNYLHNGGGLLVASMELLSRLEEVGATDFIRNVLKVASYAADPDSSGAASITGTPNEAVGDGIDTLLDYTVYETLWLGIIGDISDTLVPGPGASVVLHNDYEEAVGLRWPGIGQEAEGRLVLLTFPLDAIPLRDGVNDRTHFLRNALSFLAPGLRGLATLALDSPAYTVPARVVVELGDADLAGRGTVQVMASTESEPQPVAVTLYERLQPGVFAGSLNLAAISGGPVSSGLRAKGGDTLNLEYTNPGQGRTLKATAAVDTTPPQILNPVPDPDYEQCFVYWDTSEPADALVQFGESILLGRTAYDANYSTFHSVRLSGLVPNRTYYYRVVSRDVAGNTTTDDNNGRLYSFTTLKPLFPPWSDNMDGATTSWSVYSIDDSQSEWTLGVPDNGDVSEANSPPNAWGSNLYGDAVDWVETVLISPAIHLTNGNTATLKFAHSYDFTERTGFEIELGELSIVTSDSSKMTPLRQYMDASGGWYDEEINLTPYMGKVVYFTWHYVLFSLDPVPRPGWVVDDVSVTVANVAAGRLEVTNNLFQATFALSGPVSVLGKGTSLLLTNAPPGEYVLEFGDIPYYATPRAQTNVLAPGGSVRFTGTYAMTDTNANGISDAWETAMFGSVAPVHDPKTDTDGDGMTDHAEFIAGTQPTNPSSVLVLAGKPQGTGSLSLSWDGASGRAYRVESSLNGATWRSETDWIRASSNAVIHQTLPMPAAACLYRVQVQP